MTPRSPLQARPRRALRPQQRGVVLLFSLIALVIMLIVATALVRSFNNSLFTAGNIGFKRDLQNQSELAVDKVLREFRTGGTLATSASRGAALKASNYSETMLPTNAQGIPDALQTDTAFATYGEASNDIVPADAGVKIRYVIDRLCATTGDETTLGADTCRLADNATQPGTSESNWQGADRTINGKRGAVPQGVVYRMSIRVSGPRNTQSFFQSTFTAPST